MKRIYIEGENNPELRKVFTNLLKQELGKNMPRIVLGDGISQTIDKFRKTPLENDEERFLLVDSDEPLNDKSDLVRGVNVEKCSETKNCVYEATVDNTYFMVQEVEAWILSQPEVLKTFGVKKGLPVRNIESISKPSEELSKIYENNGKEYHKIKVFSRVFAILDSSKLKEFSSEYKALIDKLK